MKKQSKYHNELNFPAIVVATYNRPKSLNRLLNSIKKASFSEKDNIPLVISIDKADNPDVIELAEKFDWTFGEKIIVRQTEHLGLKKHILKCGDLTARFEAVIVLEDDLVVAPYFYEYALQARNFYGSDDRVAGISLYAYAIAESCFYPFIPIYDGYDNYFMQIASSWGQLWTKTQWDGFSRWIALGSEDTTEKLFPEYLSHWGDQSWKKLYIKYLISKNLYFVFPRYSLTTNFEDRGVHATSKGLYQVPLSLEPKEYMFCSLDTSQARYDAWFEIEPEILKNKVEPLKDYNFTVDLYGKKQKSSAEFFLTTKEGENPVYSFSGEMIPLVQNVISHIPGDQINLLNRKDLSEIEADYELFFPATRTFCNQKRAIFSAFTIELTIPLDSWEEQTLLKTIRSIENQSYKYWICNLVCQTSDEKRVLKILEKEQCSNRIRLLTSEVHKSREHLIEKGFQNPEGDIICWIGSKAIAHRDWFKTVVAIYNSYSNVQWLQMIHELEPSLNFRWNRNLLLHQLQKKKKHISTEGMWIAKHIWQDSKNQFSTYTSGLRQEEWILRTLKKYKLYTFIGEVGVLETVRTNTIIENAQLKELRKLHNDALSYSLLFSMIFKQCFKLKIPYLRAFYPLLHNLDDVLRYDPDMESYYMNRY